jgi:hypothetical protein
VVRLLTNPIDNCIFPAVGVEVIDPVRNAILRVDRPTGRASAKCSRCKTWVDVPLRYED